MPLEDAWEDACRTLNAAIRELEQSVDPAVVVRYQQAMQAVSNLIQKARKQELTRQPRLEGRR